jgi:hypothetical protein
VILIGFAIIGYGNFGRIGQSNNYIFEILDQNDPFVQSTIQIFVISLLCTYSITIHPTNKVLEGVILAEWTEKSLTRKWIKNIMRLFVCFAACLITILLNN